MKHKLRALRKGALILAAAVVIVAGIVLLSGYLLGGRAGVVSDGTQALSSPVQRAVGAVADWLEGVYGYLYKYDALVAENQELKKELADAQAQARAGQDALDENSRLRGLLGFTQSHPDLKTTDAKITQWSSDNWSSGFMISKGSKDGVAVGNCVIDAQGNLCGQVAELGNTWATVRAVIDVNTAVGVLVGEGGNAAMVVGDFSLMNRGMLKLTFLTAGTQLLEGDTILTSGRGEDFPAGLVIGTIDQVMQEAGGQTTFGVVKPACDFSTLSQVFVITSFSNGN